MLLGAAVHLMEYVPFTAGIPIGTRHEFVARAQRKAGRIGGSIAQCFQMPRAGVRSTHRHGERTVEAQRIQHVQPQAGCIFGAHPFQNHHRIGDAAAFQDIGKSGARVFRIHIDVAGEQRLVSQHAFRPDSVCVPPADAAGSPDAAR